MAAEVGATNADVSVVFWAGGVDHEVGVGPFGVPDELVDVSGHVEDPPGVGFHRSDLGGAAGGGHARTSAIVGAVVGGGLIGLAVAAVACGVIEQGLLARQASGGGAGVVGEGGSGAIGVLPFGLGG